MDYNFQVNLSGIIDLLANHLYSSPQVYLRELLQNGVDAIRARSDRESSFRGRIAIEVVVSESESAATLVIEDNGIGLTLEEIHRFLATIGQSSKRDELAASRQEFIGQFGIGLLSGFLVSDEIVVITRSARVDAPAYEWKGRSDGTYFLRELERDRPPGTRVYLRSKPGMEAEMQPDRVRELARHYGSLLPYPIVVTAGGKSEMANEEPPWQQGFVSDRERREAGLAYGRQVFGRDFFDCIPLHSESGGIEGIALVLSEPPSPAAKMTHRVYLKNMLLSEQISELLPDWAFFVKCIVNVRDLRPTASRETLYEDAALMAAREALGQCLRDYLVNLAQTDRARLERLISLHYLAIKALAVHDDEFYRLFIDFLPFETSLGRMTLGEYRQHYETVRYVPTLDQFRQVAQVAAAQSTCAINGGYVYDLELLEKLPSVFPEMAIARLDASDITQEFEELDFREREETFDFVRLADVVLQEYKCAARLKRFSPRDIPALYSTDESGNFRRSLHQTQEIASPHFSSLLGSLDVSSGNEPYAQLCFNYNNPLVVKLAYLKELPVLKLAIEILYVQALLLGHHPLTSQEMQLLNSGLLSAIELAIGDRS